VTINDGTITISKGHSKTPLLVGKLINARVKKLPGAQRNEGGEILAEVYFTEGEAKTYITDPNAPELIDVNGGTIVDGRIKKVDKQKLVVAEKDKEYEIALTDVCSLHSPLAYLLHVPVKKDRDQLGEEHFVAQAGPVRFCKTVETRQMVNSAKVTNARAASTAIHLAPLAVIPSLLPQLKQLLSEAYNGELKSQNQSRLPDSLSNRSQDNDWVSPSSSWIKGGFRLASYSGEDSTSLEAELVTWCQDFVSWWSAEGTWLEKGSAKRIAQLFQSGLRGQKLNAERQKFSGYATDARKRSNTIDTLINKAQSDPKSKLPAPFYDSGFVIRMCHSPDGDDCTMRILTSHGRYTNINVAATCDDIAQKHCKVGSKIRVSGMEILPEWVESSLNDLTVLEEKAPDPSVLIPLQVAYEQGMLGFALKGDSVHTDQCHIIMVNETCKPLHIIIPKGQFYTPDKPTFQIMQGTDDHEVDLQPGMSYWMEIPSLCASRKKSNRPPPAGVCYRPTCYTDRYLGRLLPRLWEVTEDFEMSHAFDNLGIPPEKRANKIAQIAVWNELARAHFSPEDEVTPGTLPTDLLSIIPVPEPSGAGIRAAVTADKQSLLAAAELVTHVSKQILARHKPSRTQPQYKAPIKTHTDPQEDNSLLRGKRKPCLPCLSSSN
jgi:hypothetical protein